MVYSIAIDGPAGAGKSTIAKKIAKELGFIYVDTGAMYRAVALYLMRNHIQAEESTKIVEACNKINVSIEYVDGEQQVILNGENVNGFIRTEEVGMMTSASSKNKDIRMKMVELQRELANKQSVVMDGRDIGTYVLPNADVKIYLTASSSERARRRYVELTAKGVTCNMEEIEKDIIARDHQDMSREFAPLRQAEDATLVDSSNMTIDEVVNEIITIFQKSHS
ncbi:(d)CMP kinase [Anaerosporobacter faecicola]|uniref:(d)CMP kinase n=1 Tax=Anaerosporobacter faecicola TaxID=2718714 RepID=UPI0014394964|nr:(d)CMP kinase [Anaerosporobacter faecicola]